MVMHSSRSCDCLLIVTQLKRQRRRHSFNRHFPRQPGLSGTGMSPFCILLELRMMEVVVTTAAIKRAKLQTNRNRQQTNIQLCTVLIWKCSGHVELVIVNLMPSSHCITRWPHQQQTSVRKLKKKYHVPWTWLPPPQLTWGLATFSLTTNGSWLLGEGLPCPSSFLWLTPVT